MPVNRDVIAIDTEKLGTVYVPILTAFAVRAVMQRAEELYPLPDPKPFEQPLPDAVIEGDVLPAANNPEYTKAVRAVMLKRNQYLQDAIIAMLRLDGATHEEVVEAYKADLEQLRRFGVIHSQDDFVAIMRHLVLGIEEYKAIIQSASQTQPLSQEEIRDGMRIFRRDLQQHPANGNRRKKSTPDLSEEESVPAQQSA